MALREKKIATKHKRAIKTQRKVSILKLRREELWFPEAAGTALCFLNKDGYLSSRGSKDTHSLGSHLSDYLSLAINLAAMCPGPCVCPMAKAAFLL